jgi:hypothetical protein
MAAIRGIFCDERSTIRLRHAAIASVIAVVGVGAGMFLIFVGSQLYEQTSHRVIWALAEGVGSLCA